METAAGARYGADQTAMKGYPVLIRYADLCGSPHRSAYAESRVMPSWGLAFNEDKTQVVSLSEGFDFLGFNVRRYHGKLLNKPSQAAVRRIRERLRTELPILRGSNARAVLKRLNPIIRGWAAYYRTQISADVFGKLDHYLWRLTLRWAKVSHSNKPTHRRLTPRSLRTNDRSRSSTASTRRSTRSPSVISRP
jgi:RNA-directed DNA polymerase